MQTQREAANRTSSIGNGTAVTTTCQVPVSLAGDAASSAEPKGSAAPDAMSPGYALWPQCYTHLLLCITMRLVHA